MPRIRLTARGIEALTTELPQEDFWDTVTPGLLLRISGATGKKTWMVRYRVGGKQRRQKVGTTERMTLADARDEARDILKRADAGEDPAQKKEELRQGLHTFGALAEEVLEARALKTRDRTQRERARILNRELLPVWDDRPVDSIDRREVVHLVEKIAHRGSPVLANRTLSLIHLIFNDGLRRGFPTLEANPAHLVERPGLEEGRDRFLEPPEIKAMWGATENEHPLTRGIFRLALLTAQRIGSVRSMRWDQISGDLWTIPADDFKGKRAHRVPLSAEALDVLEELHEVSVSEWVFPARAGTKSPHITNTSGSLERIREQTQIPAWTAHDFRTSFRTHALRSADPNGSREPAGLGIEAAVADAVLGHKESSVGFAHYTGDKLNYLIHEKREALRLWGAFVTAHSRSSLDPISALRKAVDGATLFSVTKNPASGSPTTPATN